MTRIKLCLTPLDTFFFRDGKPFSRGKQTQAGGVFPPFPSTIYGALRTEYISNNGGLQAFYAGDFKEIIGTKESESIQKASFQIKGIFLADESYSYFPLPCDIVQGKSSKKLEFLRLSNSSELISNNLVPCLLKSSGKDERMEHPINSFLKNNRMKKYLLDSIIPNKCISLDKLLTKEPKVGIGRDTTTGTTKEGLLYRMDMMRFTDNSHLCVEVDGIDFPKDQGILKLGAENKAFEYKITKEEPDLDSDEFKKVLTEGLEQKRQNGKIRFKLYFATPAIGNKGWQIENIFNLGISCKLITAAIGKYINIGGWDMAKGEPKVMYRAIPAGSLYYCEAESKNTSAKDIIKAFHYQNLSDQRSKEGFGLTFVGVV